MTKNLRLFITLVSRKTAKALKMLLRFRITFGVCRIMCLARNPLSFQKKYFAQLISAVQKKVRGDSGQKKGLLRKNITIYFPVDLFPL